MSRSTPEENVTPSSVAGSSVRLLFAASIGSIIEWYDFAVFAFCAALVFNNVFFPEASPVVGLIAALMTQAGGFIARPAGGWFFGILGDKIGRKRALVISLYLMGGATLAMGLLPTWQQAGILAPLLLLILRLLQGFAIGGESTGALVMIAESLPARQRGLWTGFPMIGGPTGNLLATSAIGAVIGVFGSPAFSEWAWRIPFLASVVLIGVGAWVRRKVEESPAFQHIQSQHQGPAKAPLREALTLHWRNMLRVLIVKTGESALFYLFSSFFIILATVFLNAPREQALTAMFVGSLAEVVFILAAGALADRIGRRIVTIVGFVGGTAAGFFLFALEPGASATLLTLSTVVTLSFHGIIVGGMSPWFTELFPARVRFTAMSTSYSLATVLGGALSPVIGTWLLNLYGVPFAVAIYAALMAIPAIYVMLTSPETKGRDLIDHR